MKKLFIVLLLAKATITIYAQDIKAPTLKSILFEQLRTTHNVKDWFVPVNIALEGLTPEQVKWKDGSGNHSIGQLASHLIFWNLQQLMKFKTFRNRLMMVIMMKPSTVSTVITGKPLLRNWIVC